MVKSCDTHGTAADSCWCHIPFIGLHLVDTSGYVSLCLADSLTSLTTHTHTHTHQTRAATHVCCSTTPSFPSVTEPQVHTAHTPSPSCLVVVLLLKSEHRLPGRMNSVDLPHTHTSENYGLYVVSHLSTLISNCWRHFPMFLTWNFCTATNAHEQTLLQPCSF